MSNAESPNVGILTSAQCDARDRDGPGSNRISASARVTRAIAGKRSFAQRFFAASLLAFALSLIPSVHAETKIGDAFPALAAAGLVPLGDTAESPSTAGKVVLVDFWASWCAPCKASFSMMAQLHKDFAARGLVIVAVGIDEKPAAAAAFVRKLAPPFVTLHDREQTLVKQVVVPTMPTSYLLGRDGRVRFVHQGFHGDATERELRKELESLLTEGARS